jgi:hypothetical protein
MATSDSDSEESVGDLETKIRSILDDVETHAKAAEDASDKSEFVEEATEALNDAEEAVSKAHDLENMCSGSSLDTDASTVLQHAEDAEDYARRSLDEDDFSDAKDLARQAASEAEDGESTLSSM